LNTTFSNITDIISAGNEASITEDIYSTPSTSRRVSNRYKGKEKKSSSNGEQSPVDNEVDEEEFEVNLQEDSFQDDESTSNKLHETLGGKDSMLTISMSFSNASLVKFTQNTNSSSTL